MPLDPATCFQCTQQLYIGWHFAYTKKLLLLCTLAFASVAPSSFRYLAPPVEGGRKRGNPPFPIHISGYAIGLIFRKGVCLVAVFRWTSANRQIVPFTTSSISSGSSSDEALLAKYPAPSQSVDDIVSVSTLSVELNRRNYITQMRRLLQLEELTQTRIIARYDRRRLLELFVADITRITRKAVRARTPPPSACQIVM